jgi:fluoroacetyl-CoA thioesterase
MNVRHLAATPVGQNVRAEAEVIKVEGKRIEFKVPASDEIGNGTRQRTVIDLRAFNERLAARASVSCATASKWCAIQNKITNSYVIDITI